MRELREASLGLVALITWLWRLPHLADMPWKGLRLYAPDLAHLVQWLSIASLVVSLVALLRFL